MMRIKTILVIAVILLVGITSYAQFTRGTVKESLKIESEILGKTVNYTIYLPFDYATSNRLYPVTYLLHGYSDNDMGWMQFGEAHLIADELIAKREIPPMIIAMPDGGVSFYINNFDNSVRYEDFFVQEFIPYIEKIYRIRSEKRYRAVAGLSMGGYGTLMYSLKYPEMFSAAVAFSAAIFSEEGMMNVDAAKYKRVYAPVFGPDKGGKERLTDHYRKNNPFDVTKTKGIEAYRRLRLMMDCGDDDFLTIDNCLLHIHLTQMGVQHEFRMRDGAHSWTYWRSGFPDALKFIGESFH
jgi:S-formylglutathione hydrolase FrmB